jgi:hypothetical protein
MTRISAIATDIRNQPDGDGFAVASDEHGALQRPTAHAEA